MALELILLKFLLCQQSMCSYCGHGKQYGHTEMFNSFAKLLVAWFAFQKYFVQSV